MAVGTRETVWKRGLSPTSGLTVVLGFLTLFFGIRGYAYLVPASPPWLAPVGFVVMAATPWIVFNRRGRREAGLVRARSVADYGVGALAGALAALVCFLVGIALFGETADNWFMTVAATYHARDPGGLSTLTLHLIFTLPALIFSPVGEELYFRGTLLRSLEEKTSRRTATLLQAAAFGLLHIFHHGLSRGPDGVRLLALSGLIWVVLMFGSALVFAWARERSGSLYPAMVSHASFNLVMNMFIFSFLWS
ncbi:MAG TPA: type II CAAX endopeptidase family protein [Acidimicrobiia bacterium]